MGLSDNEIAAAQDLFRDLGGITSRRMMGGLCLYQDGTIFAIVMGDGAIYLKGAGDFVATLETEGCTRWTYARQGKAPVAMPYWSLPEAALDDPDQACEWARRALEHLRRSG